MVYAKLACLALIACLCQVSHAQSMRRVRPGCAVPQRVVPRVPAAPAAYRPYDKNGDHYRYECSLEEIISKLINALIYTTLRKDGSGAGAGGVSGGGAGGGGGGAGGGHGSGGGAGAGGSGSTDLLNLLIRLLGVDVLNLDVLPGISGDGGSDGGTQRNSNNPLLEVDSRLLGRDLLNLDLIGGQ